MITLRRYHAKNNLVNGISKHLQKVVTTLRRKMIDSQKSGVPKVSVIVPVFNPGTGIRRCIDSLRRQSLKDIELIFIDDACTNEDMKWVYAAAREDKRIHILVNTANIGAGPSRNRGIDEAKGEYLSFVDPDDFIAERFLELLYSKAIRKNVDIVKGSAVICYPDTDPATEKPNTKAREYITKGLSKKKSLYLLFTWEHWSAIYRRETLIRSGARYGTSRNAQDVTFLLRICLATQSFAFEDDALYYYVMRKNSAVHTYDSQRADNLLLAFHEQLMTLSESGKNDDEVLEYVYYKTIELLHFQIQLMCVSGMNETAEFFLKKIRECILSLSFSQQLSEKYFPIEALIQYGANLCPFRSPYVWTENIERFYSISFGNWIEFAQNHPELVSKYKEKIEMYYLGVMKYFTAEYAKSGLTPELDELYRTISTENDRYMKIVK